MEGNKDFTFELEDISDTSSVFKKPNDQYKLNLDPVGQYIKQGSCYLSKMMGLTQDEAKVAIKKAIKINTPKNPIVTYNRRKENGDMEVTTDKLTNYLKSAIDDGEIIVPSFTTYIHPSKQKSIHSIFLEGNVKARKTDKHLAFKYKQLGDEEKASYFTDMQKTRKVLNNSLSGAYASASTILYNPSAHYTLTSITRCVASIGNAVTESVIGGNKLFLTSHHVINYISAILANVHINTIAYAIDKFKMNTPTPKQVMDSILFSSRRYWEDPTAEANILDYLQKLSAVELAAVMYTNDLWHIKELNPDLVRNILHEMSQRMVAGSDDPLRDITKAPEGVANLTHHICMGDIKGMDVVYDKMIGSETLMILGSTAKHITETLLKYKVFFRAFFSSDIMPIDIFNIKEMLRENIVLSDTDSTCGAYDQWVMWYFGKLDFSPAGVGIAAAAMTINTQVMDHTLKLFAKNMNIPDDAINLVKMKNEFFWTVFIVMNMNKHYFADTVIQEGAVFAKSSIELKGVHLIASAIDQSLTKMRDALIVDINTSITEGKKLSLYKYIKMVADTERELIKKINSGDISVYKFEKIKQAETYKNDPDKSPYLHHVLWKTVFSEKYGESGDPMYMAIKVPLTTDTANKMATFLSEIKDDQIREGWTKFMEENGKDGYKTFRVPATIAVNKGIPEEIIPVINIEHVVQENCNLFYIILESLGFYRKPKTLISNMGY